MLGKCRSNKNDKEEQKSTVSLREIQTVSSTDFTGTLKNKPYI